MNMQFIAIFSCPLCSSARISWINLISGTNTNHEWTMCRVKFPGQKVKGQGHRGHRKFGACPHCSSVRISWIDLISGTNTKTKHGECLDTFCNIGASDFFRILRRVAQPRASICGKNLTSRYCKTYQVHEFHV